MKRGRKKIEWTNEMLKKLEMEYCVKGKSIQVCVQGLGLSYGVVRRKLEELGWLRKQKSAMEWSQEELEKLRRMYCVEGLPLQACARNLGASDWVVKAKLQEMGITVSKNKSERGGKREDEVAAVCNDLYDIYKRFLSYSISNEEARESYEQFASRLKRLINDMWKFEFEVEYPEFRRKGRNAKIHGERR